MLKKRKKLRLRVPGTKGLEFKNVVIVLEDGFGTKKEDKVFLKSFLEDYLILEPEQQVIEHEKARNLLYVAVTRAIENLKVIYLGNRKGRRNLGLYF